MLHKAFTITEIALYYYSVVHPERKYSRNYAVKQWRQDKNIDKKIVKQIIKSIFKEQREMLKKTK